MCESDIMSVQSIKSSDIPQGRYCNVGGAAIFGLLAGNAAHDIIPLSKSEMPTRADIKKITKYAYTDSYIKMSRDLDRMNTRTPARDVFVEMFQYGDFQKNYLKAMKALEKTPDALKELKNLVWLTNQEASSNAHTIINQQIRAKKSARPVLPFIIIGGIVATLGAVMYNLTNAMLYSED